MHYDGEGGILAGDNEMLFMLRSSLVIIRKEPCVQIQ